MIIVNVREARIRLSALVERAHAGEEVIVVKAGRPYARIVSLAAPPERVGGRYPGTVPYSFFEPLPDEELEAWER